MGSMLQEKIKEDVAKSARHLDYSCAKVESLKLLERPVWEETDLEILESFTSRFVRTSDLIISRYLRLWALAIDPAFDGALIDLLNLAEKHNLIEAAAIWWDIRKLRNVATHDYADTSLREVYREVLRLAPHVLQTAQRICA